MRVETETATVTIYHFTREEVSILCKLGIWDILNQRLLSLERIEIDYS